MCVCAVYTCVSCVMCAPTVRLLSTVRCPSEPHASLLSGGRCLDRDGLGASSQSCCFLCNLLAPAAQGIRPAQSGPKPCRASLASLSLSPVPSASSPTSPPTIHLSHRAVSSVNSPGPAHLPALPPGQGQTPGSSTSGPGGASLASPSSLQIARLHYAPSDDLLLLFFPSPPFF